MVLGLVAQVADDDVVQGADGLAEAQRVPERAVEADAVAAQVRRQRHGQARITANDTAAPVIAEAQETCAAPCSTS